MLKVYTEGRKFNERWESKYMSALNGDKLICLLCNEAVAMKYNLQSQHGAKYAKPSYQEKQQKVKELKGSLCSQQNVCKC